MTWFWVIVAICLIVIGFSKSITDHLSHTKERHQQSRLRSRWMNDNWVLKYKHEKDVVNGEKHLDYLIPIGGPTKHWWYLGLHTTDYPEKFIFSSTILSFLTDGWHFFNFTKLRAIYTLVALGAWDYDCMLFGSKWLGAIAIVFILCPIIVGLIFQPLYEMWEINEEND